MVVQRIRELYSTGGYKEVIRGMKDFITYRFINKIKYYSLVPVSEIIYNSNNPNKLRKYVVKYSKDIRKHPRKIYVDKGDIAVIVGTPYPERLVEMSRIVGENGLVIIIEPDEENIRKLRDVERENTKIIEKAIWHKNEKLKFMIGPKGRKACSKIVSLEYTHDIDFREGYYDNITTVEGDTLDNILTGYDVDYLEIMINGAELDALKGAKRTLKDKPKLLVKGHSLNKETKEPIQKDIIEYLKKYNYTIQVSKGGGGKPEIDKNIDWDRKAGDIFAH